jgi:hypothetical protein
MSTLLLQQPTIDGKVDGIIALDPMVLQCRDCGETVTQPEGQRAAAFIILSGFHFCPHEPKPKRRCPACLSVVRADCPPCKAHGP